MENLAVRYIRLIRADDRFGHEIHRHDVEPRGAEVRKEAARAPAGQEFDDEIEDLEVQRVTRPRIADNHARPMHRHRQTV